MNKRPPEPEPGPRQLTKDPVRIVWIIYGIIQSVVVILMAAELVTSRLASVVTGCALVAYVAVSELYVRKETVPVYELERDTTEKERPVGS